MNPLQWDGHLPRRRYAIFIDTFQRKYGVVLRGRDIDLAEKWGGFVAWVGGGTGRGVPGY